MDFYYNDAQAIKLVKQRFKEPEKQEKVNLEYFDQLPEDLVELLLQEFPKQIFVEHHDYPPTIFTRALLDFSNIKFRLFQN